MWTTIMAVSLGLSAGFAGGYGYRSWTYQQVAVTVQATSTVDPACEDAKRLLHHQTFGGIHPSYTPQGHLPNLSK